MIDPEFWLDEGLAALSAYARLLYIGLWGICDDNHATLPNRPLWIKAQVFPYNDIDIDIYVRELIEAKKLLPFLNEGQPFLFLKNFFKYQKVDHPSSEKYPSYQESSESPREPSPSPRSQSNISKSNLIEVKLTQLATETVAGVDPINLLIPLFEPVNPSYRKFFPNTTQRSALGRLVKILGLEELAKLISVLPETNKNRFAPTITTPVQLEDKLGLLQAFAQKHKPEDKVTKV